jgi:1-acyl-sn-glycerol-3-phosphate acyltransferase
MMLYTGVRHFNVPDLRGRGGLLLASNHQSFFDPVLVGMALPEPICYLARSGLFETPGFGALIRALGAHPIARGRADARALKTVLRLLAEGEAVLMFPEGTRTRDGSLGRFKPGVAAIAIRAGVPVLPVCVAGVYRCWPRTRALPRPGRTAVAYGEPVPPEGASAQGMTDEVRRRVTAMQERLRAYLARTG